MKLRFAISTFVVMATSVFVIVTAVTMTAETATAETLNSKIVPNSAMVPNTAEKALMWKMVKKSASMGQWCYVPLEKSKGRQCDDPADEYNVKGVLFSQPHGAVTGAQGILTKVLARLPNGDFKNGLKQYIKVLGLQEYGSDFVGGKNYGIVGYFRKEVATNSCYARLADQFYNQVRSVGSPEQDGVNQKLSYILSLSEKSGQGRYEKLKPGWLWDLAMTNAKGDPNLAMALIGTCGNDDIALNFQYLDRSSEGLSERDVLVRALDQNIRNENSTLEKLYSKGKKDSYQALNAKCEVKRESLQKALYLQCPGIARSVNCVDSKINGFYAPQSLGQDADIGQSLKNKIANIQAPTMGAAALPSKYYHVLGGAFMACQMIQQGVSPFVAKLVEEEAARMYRVIRLCEDSSGQMQYRDYLDEIYHKAIKNGETKATNFTEFVIEQSLKALGPVRPQKVLKPSAPANKIFFYYPGTNPSTNPYANPSTTQSAILAALHIPYDKDLTEVMIRKKTKILMARLNAAALYQKWYLHTKILSQSMSCTDIRFGGPPVLDPVDDPFHFIDKKSCGSTMSATDCDDARRELETWRVDEDWTMAQHKAGAEFAAKHCKKLKAGESPLSNACTAAPKTLPPQWQPRSI